MNHRRFAPLILGLAALAGCATHAAPRRASGGLSDAPTPAPAKVEYPAGGDGVIAVSGPVFIAGQPTEESLRRLVAEKGITVVINLRTPKEMDDRESVKFDEAAVLRDLGVEYVHVPLGRPDHLATPAKVDEVASALARHTGAALLHCASAGRASHMWAAYLIRHRGVEPAKAIAQANTIQPNTPIVVDLIGARWGVE